MFILSFAWFHPNTAGVGALGKHLIVHRGHLGKRGCRKGKAKVGLEVRWVRGGAKENGDPLPWFESG